MTRALRAPTGRIAAGLGALCALLWTPLYALAQPWEVNGLRGGRFVGSAAPPSQTPRAVLGLGYAYTEGVIDDTDRHQRAFTHVGIGYAPWAALQAALELEARYDAHRSDVSGKDSGGAFASTLATRHAFELTRALWLAAQARVRFPASSNALRGLRSASPELGLLGSYLLRGGSSELSLALGYRFDRSDKSVRAPDNLSPGDRLAASLSRYDQALLGALFAQPIGPVLASLEWSWDVAVGGSAPPPRQSPMRLRLAGQMRLGERYLPGVELGVSPSARPAPDRGVRIEPRLWVALTFGIAFERRAERALAPPPPPPSAPEEPEPEPALLELRVVDPAGAPIAGARVELVEEVDERGSAGSSRETEADGRALLTLAPERNQRVRIEKEGFLAHEAELARAPGRSSVTVTLARDLPEGEIKGKVRSLRGGGAVRAQVIVEPLGIAVDTDDEGNFVLDVPPGQYRLEIRASGYEPQQRDALVERLGVTILVVDLRRAAK